MKINYDRKTLSKMLSPIVYGTLLLAGVSLGNEMKNEKLDAEVLRMVGPQVTTKWAGGGRTDENFDSIGPFTFSGNEQDINSWLWCIEKHVTTNTGANYSGQDIFQANFNVRSPFNRNQTTYAVSHTDKIAMATMGYIAFRMPEEKLAILFKDDPGLLQAIKDLRKIPDHHVKFYYVQVLYWRISEGFLQNMRVTQTVGYQPANNYRGVLDRLYGMKDAIVRKYNDGTLVYNGGARIWSSGDRQRIVTGAAADVDIKAQEGYLKIRKTINPLKPEFETNHKANHDFNGLKFGVYSDENATDRKGILTIGANNESENLKLEPGTYYVYELNANEEPIKSAAQEVGVNKTYVSGKSHQGTYYAKVEVGSDDTTEAPETVTFINETKLVNFKMAKTTTGGDLSSVDDIYDVTGAEFTLYKDALATDPVLRNGQPLTVAVNDEFEFEFTNLEPQVYYLKETKLPNKAGLAKSIFKENNNIIKIDLSNPDENNSLIKLENKSNDATQNETVEYVPTGLTGLFGEDIINAPRDSTEDDFTIKKIDSDLIQIETDSFTQGQGTFEGAEFKVEFYEPMSISNGNPKLKWTAYYKLNRENNLKLTDRSLYLRSDNEEMMQKLFEMHEQHNIKWAFEYKVTEIKAPNGYKLPKPGDDIKEFTMQTNDNPDSLTLDWGYANTPFVEDDLELHIFKRQRVDNTTLYGLSAMQPAEDKAISGVTFNVVNWTTGYNYGNVVTDENGKIRLHGVADGDYVLTEVNPTNKYQQNNQVIRFAVGEINGSHGLLGSTASQADDRNAPYAVSTDNNGDISIVYDNTPKDFDISLKKLNENAKELEGATFKLTHIKDDGSTEVVGEYKTDANGNIDFDVNAGHKFIVGDIYEVEETAAPKGYKLPRNKVRVQFRVNAIPVDNNYSVDYRILTLDQYLTSNTTEVDSGWMKLTQSGTAQNGIKYDVNQDLGEMHVSFSFENHTMRQLPNTGSHLSAILYGVATLAVLGSATAVVINKKKKTN